jgi:Fe(3+) dicitrate transport protein
VWVRETDAFGIRPQIGMHGTRNVTLLEDGVLLGPAPYSSPSATYFPLMDRMQSARIAKWSVVEGRGVVDLATRDIPSGKRGTYDLALGKDLFNKQHLTYGASGDTVGFLIEGMRLDTSGFQDRDGGGDTGFTRNEWLAKARWTPDPRAEVVNEFRVKLSYADEGSNVSPLGLTDADFRVNQERLYAATAGDRTENRRTGVALTHEVRLSQSMRITTTAYRNEMHLSVHGIEGVRGADLAAVLREPNTGAKPAYRAALEGTLLDPTEADRAIVRGTDDHRYVSQGLQSVVSAEGTTGPISHRLRYGVRAHYDEDAHTDTLADDKTYSYATAMWAEDAIAIGDVTVVPSIRIEGVHSAFRDSIAQRTDAATYQELLPGGSVHYALSRDLGVFGGVHRSFRPSIVATPEESVDWEGGARYATRYLRAEAVGFYDVYRDIVVVDGGGGERARAGGVETYAHAELPLPQGYFLPVRVSYTFTYREVLATGEPIPWVPAHQAAGWLGLEKAEWGVNVSGTFVDSVSEGLGKPADARFIVDASARYRIFEHLDLYATGRNLTNDRYVMTRRPFGARPGAPIGAFAGLRGDF